MAQSGDILFQDGNSITILNDSGTSTITAGDLLYFTTNDDKFGTTVATAASAYSASDIVVKAAHWSASSHLLPAGVALTDVAVDGYGSMALEGIFLHRVSANTEAGESIMHESSTSQKVVALVDLGTTVLVQGAGLADLKVGRALTGGTAEDKIIAWKLTL